MFQKRPEETAGLKNVTFQKFSKNPDGTDLKIFLVVASTSLFLMKMVKTPFVLGFAQSISEHD